jgi:hypothetical protein
VTRTQPKVAKALNEAWYALFKLEQVLESPNNQSWFLAQLGDPPWFPELISEIQEARKRLSVLKEAVSDGPNARAVREALRTDHWKQLFEKPDILAILSDPAKMLFLELDARRAETQGQLVGPIWPRSKLAADPRVVVPRSGGEGQTDP